MDYSFADAKTTKKKLKIINIILMLLIEEMVKVIYLMISLRHTTLKQITSDNQYVGNNGASQNSKGGHW